MAKLKANQFEYRPGLVITERQIPFQTDMVQAILEGRKTQTRRTKGLNHVDGGQFERMGFIDADQDHYAAGIRTSSSFLKLIKSPYGKPGDLLWVRESFGRPALDDELASDPFLYKADYLVPEWVKSSLSSNNWKPSIHMPKDAARIWLMVEDVRVERLQDISEEDAIAEGIEYAHKDDFRFFKDYTGRKYHLVRGGESFETLWISINGKESWDSNPWVWVVKFRMLSKTGRPSREEILSAYYDVTSECNANEETASPASGGSRSDASDKRKEVSNG